MALSSKSKKPGPGTRLAVLAFGCLALLFNAPIATAEDSPERVNDLAYGWVLYNYHQGEAFEALTLLDVARERGGIRGHGDYPELVEGGLMLSYGMTREARELFIRLLEDEKNTPRVTLAPEVRTQAWFYLGKVFYLEGDYTLAYENLQRVDSDVLEEADTELYAEWLYLRAQLALMSDSFRGEPDDQAGNEPLIEHLRQRLVDSSPWVHYLNYNLAMAQVNANEFSSARQSLRELIAAMEDEPPKDELISEHQALLDKTRLSLARLYLRDGEFDRAVALLGTMPLDGVFSDRALFDYAVAAAGLGEMQRALDALDALSQRALFLSWRQQIPYARGYVLEQMGQHREALESFSQASTHYEARVEELMASRHALTEESLMSRLSFLRDSDEIITDAYGRLRVTPADFGLSEILTAESFQQALKELNELYRMQALLNQRESQLSTFETMLETRQMQRERRSAETRLELAQQQPEEWIQELSAFRVEIDAALAQENAEFFMTTEQKVLKARLGKVAATLEQLPDDERTASQRKKYQRMKAYFDWTVANDYGVNRWAAQKELRELTEETERFQAQRFRIETQIAGDSKHSELAGRLANNSLELQELKTQVQTALDEARGLLMNRLDEALQQQSDEVRRYLVASRHAQARLADQLFRAGQGLEAAND